MDIIRKENMFAIQVDLFDNRHNGKDGLGLAVRIETDKTDGAWFHLSSQMSSKRKPSQTKRYVKTSFDMELFNYMKDMREQLSLTNKTGWDFTPVITTFYEKNHKAAGILPSIMGLVWKETGDDWRIIMNIGHYRENLLLEPKENQFKKKIYYAFERYQYNDKISFRRGF
jgi:hypothetical protein